MKSVFVVAGLVAAFFTYGSCSPPKASSACTTSVDCQSNEECSDGACRSQQDVDVVQLSPLDVRSPIDARTSVDASIDAAIGVDAADVPMVDASLPDVSTGLVAVGAPPSPPSSPNVRTVSIAIKTATTSNADTDDGIEVCLSDEHCFRFNTPDINDFQLGKTDLLHFDTDTERRLLNQVRVRTVSDPAGDNDRFTPACIEVLFDGEPQYCNDALEGVHIGTGDSAGERIEYFSTPGIFTCNSCQPESEVVLGVPEPNALRILTRSQNSRRIGLRMGLQQDLSDGVVVAWAFPSPEHDFNHTFVVDQGILPDTQYYFRIESETTFGTTRAVRSAPVQSTTTRFAVGSCTRLDEQPIFDTIQTFDPDFFVFLGDTHYANSNQKEAHRWRYRDFRWNVSERASFFANVPTLASWDDHDFLENNSNGTCEGADDIEELLENTWPNPINENKGIYTDYRRGDVHLFALDCRSFKPALGQCQGASPCSDSRPDSGSRCGTDAFQSNLDPNYGLIGRSQRDWLLDKLGRSDATFKVVSCGTQWSSDGSRDSWGAFLPARDALIDEMAARNIEGLVFMSGDIHKSTFQYVQSNGRSIPEVTSSGMSYASYGSCPNPNNRTDPTEFCFENAASFVLLESDSSLADPTLTAKLIDGSGVVQHTWTILRSTLTLQND